MTTVFFISYGKTTQPSRRVTMARGRMPMTLTMRLALLVGSLLWALFHLPGATLPVAATGANVDESRVQKTYFVDASSADAADDDKHGTAEAPFVTISHACKMAVLEKERNVGAKVIIASGVYRESIEIRAPRNGGADTDAPLVIESAERQQSVIDGADTEGWSASTWKIEGGDWTHPWPFKRSHAAESVVARSPHPTGESPAANGEVSRHGDLIFVNGVLLRQVNRMEELAPGCFWIRTAATVKKMTPDVQAPAVESAVLVRPPAETELGNAIIQVAVRRMGLAVHGRQNVVIRGLLLQHAADPSDKFTDATGLCVDGCSNVLIEDVLIEWNAGSGLTISGLAAPSWNEDVTLRQVHLLHNGGSGLSAGNIKNFLVEDSEACFNNFRGEWAGRIDLPGAAGVKTTRLHGVTLRRLRAVGNFCRGVWWNGDHTDVTLDAGDFRNNFISGLCVENSPGPVMVRHCLVIDTKALPDVQTGIGGIVIAATPETTLEGNIIAGNAVTQLSVWDKISSTSDSKFGRNPLKTSSQLEHHTYRHNVFCGADAAQNLVCMPAMDVGKGDVHSYYRTLDSGENCFWNPAQTEVFVVRSNPIKPMAAGMADIKPGINLESWQTAFVKPSSPNDGELAHKTLEHGSLWQDPLFADPAEGDYRLREKSPAANWELLAEEGPAPP